LCSFGLNVKKSPAAEITEKRVLPASTYMSMGESRSVYRLLVGKHEEKKLLGRPRSRWKDNIKMDLLNVGRGGMDWIDLAQDRDRWRALVMR